MTNSVVPSWNDSGFPIFEPANDEYFALKHARVKLEVAIREHLAEPILGAMLASYGYKVEFFRTTSMFGFPINGVLGRRLPFNLTIERNGIKRLFAIRRLVAREATWGARKGSREAALREADEQRTDVRNYVIIQLANGRCPPNPCGEIGGIPCARSRSCCWYLRSSWRLPSR